MFVRLTVFPVRPATFTSMIATVRNDIVPLNATHAGFLGAQLLTRTRIDKAVLQTTWRTEYDALQADEDGLLDREMSFLEPYASGPAVVEGFEVSVLFDAAPVEPDGALSVD
ncbi:MAG: hypothetical protein BMS9Abin07_1216 [Acidimicrobiia bacterium]|nr:MAG: hypothetical protein BMS9Abin07_1216 [Acidimicrobiia bacterium]